VSRNGGRKLLYSPQYIAGFARAYREARRDLDDMHAKQLREMAQLRRELDETRAEFDELKGCRARPPARRRRTRLPLSCARYRSSRSGRTRPDAAAAMTPMSEDALYGGFGGKPENIRSF